MSFGRLAEFYDALYSFKDYAAEAQEIESLLAERGLMAGASILDVGCGTGKHLSLLASKYKVAGVDLSEDMLTAARTAVPAAEFLTGDMRTFDFGRLFDACLCLFSSVGYMPDVKGLNEAVANMARHVRPGGVLAIEAWLKPEAYLVGHVSMTVADHPHLKLSRIGTTKLEGNVSVFEMHCLAGTADKVDYFVEQHRLTLFTDDEYQAAFVKAGLNVTRLDGVLTGRGLWVATV